MGAASVANSMQFRGGPHVSEADMDNWKQLSDYGWEHPSGWAIALMRVHGEASYMLSREGVIHGPFDSLWDAKARHAILVPAFEPAEIGATDAVGGASA